MLRYGGDDRNMNLGVSSIPERVETTSPWRNDSGDCKENKTSKRDGKDSQNKTSKEGLELLAWYTWADELNEPNKLQKTENTFIMLAKALAYWKLLYLPSEDMCSELRIGKNPTKGICILANVPSAYQVV